MQQATADISTRVERNTRYPHTFHDVDRALEAARGQFPTTVVLKIGTSKGDSLFAHDAATVRTLANLQSFGRHSRDTVIIYLRGQQHQMT